MVDPVVIHLHVYKTAGTALKKLLRREVSGKSWRYQPGDLQRLAAMPPEERGKLQLVFGHLDYGIHRLLREDYLYLVVLRSPRERLFSLYRFLARAADHPLHEICRGRPFGEFLELAFDSPQVGRLVDNAQVRQLAGDASIGFPLDEQFEIAREHLADHRTLLGLTERFEAFVARLRGRGLVGTGKAERHNAASEALPLSRAIDTLAASQDGLLEHFCRWDDRLYKLAAERLG